MPRPLDIEDHVFDEDLIAAYIREQAELDQEAAGAHDVYKNHVGAIEKHRKSYQAKKLNTEAIDLVRKLKNGKAPKALGAFLRTFDIARRIENLDAQGDMFGSHVSKGEADAVAEAAA